MQELVRGDHAELQSTGNVYRVLGRLWLKEVDAALLTQFGDAEFEQAFRDVGGEVPSIDMLDELATDYCRLLIGPKQHLPPIQSVWQRGELQSDTTASVSDFAAAMHYLPPSHAVGGIADHFGLQLDMMGTLFSNRAKTDDPALSREMEAFANAFFTRHLEWADRFLQAVRQRAGESFYGSVATITLEFLASQRSATPPE